MNNNFRVSFYLAGKSKAKKDGTRPVLYRIHLGSERLDMGATGYAVDERKWETKKGRLYGNTGNEKYINKELETKESDLRTIYRKYEFSDRLSLDLIRSEYFRNDVEEVQTFMPYFDEYIQKRTEEVGHGLTHASIQKYKVTRRRFSEYLELRHKRKDIRFAELDYQMISGFEHFLKTEIEMVNNTAMRMLKTFKTVIIEAKAEGLITRDPYLGIKMHMDPVDRGFLTDEEIEALMSHDFDIKRLEQVRDIFVFSCFTGLAYIDVAQLTYDNIVEMNGKQWIVTRRQKTSVSAHIPLLDIPLMLIEKYKGKTKNDHVFPVMSNQKSNAYLKEIAAVCGLNKNLTCHLARHTFATLALSKVVPVESVSRMLGHTNIKTTQIYARITNKKVENDMIALAEKLTSFDGKMANMKHKEKELCPVINDCPENHKYEHSSESDKSIKAEDRLSDSPVGKLERPNKEVDVKQSLSVAEPVVPAKKRGRPKKQVVEQQVSVVEQVPPTEPAKRRGRPRKQVAEQTSPIVEQKGTSTAFVNGRMITVKDPTFRTKRQRIPVTKQVEHVATSSRR